ncbi:MAG TPA: dienelactone hydrolase family protein [Bradyrhizobium sp.]
MTNLAEVTAFATALLFGNAAACLAAESSAIIVEIESPLASPLPLQGYLRQTNSAGPSPAVVLLHGCNGNWEQLDQRWGKRIASWGFVTLTVDSFGPRGIKTNCGSAPDGLALDAFRALNFLVREPFVDPDRVAVVGFGQGGGLVLTSVEHGAVEQTSPDKFHAAVAFYPPCRKFNGDMTVPTLILIGERDDWTEACRNMVDGRDDWGLSRQKGKGAPVRLIVYPGAYHAFDVPNLNTSTPLPGHHREFNQSATDQSIVAVRKFLDATIGGGEPTR